MMLGDDAMAAKTFGETYQGRVILNGADVDITTASQSSAALASEIFSRARPG
jgi:hypothetical protein